MVLALTGDTKNCYSRIVLFSCPKHAQPVRLETKLNDQGHRKAHGLKEGQRTSKKLVDHNGTV